MTKTTIGIDISKATLDVHRLSDDVAVQFSNDKVGFRALKAWLKGDEIARIVYEPTGPYHRNFEVALEADFPLAKVNPLQARRFAQSRGTRAKTDAVDARMLAMMGEAFSLPPQPQTPVNQRDLKELHIARLALLKDRSRTLNRQRTLTLAVLKHQAKARLKQMKTQLEAIDQEIEGLLQSSPKTARATEIICSIPGLSRISASDRDARAWNPQQKTGRQPRRSCPHDTTIGSVAWQIFHPGGPQIAARFALYASACRHAPQPGPQGQIHRPHCRRKASQSCLGCAYAKTHHPRKCSDP